MLARPLEIRSSPHAIEIHGMTPLVTAMNTKPNSRPRHPGLKSRRRMNRMITASATQPEAERSSSSTRGVRSWTASLMRRKETPQISARATKATYGSSGWPRSDTGAPLIGGQDQRHRPVIGDVHAHDGSKAPGLRLYSALAELLHELLVQLLCTRWVARLEQARTAAAAHVGEQRELRHDQR